MGREPRMARCDIGAGHVAYGQAIDHRRRRDDGAERQSSRIAACQAFAAFAGMD